jgi:hypothetical protein
MKQAITLILALTFCVCAVQGVTLSGDITTKKKGGAKASAQCSSGQLSVKAGDEDAAMGGVRTMTYTFTNTSSSPCTLNGYPVYELLNKAGHPVPGKRAINKAKMMVDTDPVPPKEVTLDAGKTAIFFVYYNNGGAGYLGKPCPTYPKVRITAPGTKKGFVLKADIQTCIRPQVSSVRPPTTE